VTGDLPSAPKPALDSVTEEAAPTGRRPSAKSEAGAAKVEGKSGSKTLEAPHRRQQETLATRISGQFLLAFWRTSSWIMGHIPPGPAYRIGGAFMMIGYAVSPERRRWLRTNFGHVLGVSPKAPAAGRLARKAYRNYARYIMELMRLPWLKEEQKDALLDISNLGPFFDLARKSEGMILAAAHLGNNEAAGAGFVKQGMAISVVGDDTAYQALYDLFERQRGDWGLKMISWRNLRGVYSALRKKDALVLLVDWGYRADDIPVKMFGTWTTLPAGPAILAARFKCPIVPFTIKRLPAGNFRALTSEPILVPSNAPADLAVATQAMATALEAYIAEAPEQWYIFKPIWPATEQEQRQLESRFETMLAAKVVGPGSSPEL
jgi:lauroyl/myristoyl acyltransferase